MESATLLHAKKKSSELNLSELTLYDGVSYVSGVGGVLYTIEVQLPCTFDIEELSFGYDYYTTEASRDYDHVIFPYEMTVDNCPDFYGWLNDGE